MSNTRHQPDCIRPGPRLRLLCALLLLCLSAPARAADLPPGDRSGLMLQAIVAGLDAQADEWFHQGDFQRCAQHFRLRIAYDPRALQPYFLGAWLLWSDGMDAQAQQMLQSAVRAAPESYEPYLEAGLHWSNRRDDRTAALWLTHACLRNGPAQAWKSLSHCYRRLGLIEDALRAMRQARALDPGDPAIAQNLRWLEELRASPPDALP